MVRTIVTEEEFLSEKSVPATPEDLSIVEDLMDTLKENTERCVGMAANMIGYHKCIIVISMGATILPMLNPKIVSQEEPYETEEGCLSLEGMRKTKRFDTIEVEFQDRKFRTKRRTYSGWTAQIIQHEIDHCNGIII